MTITEKAKALINYIESLQDFTILDGDNNAVADIHPDALEGNLYNFVAESHLPVENAAEAHQVVQAAADHMGLPHAQLEYSIWQYMMQ